ncbi:MAG TPA: DNA repair protein RecN [Bacteroidota bacterium]|nr:DNA repair protein RecN [Bacteroidota bacterium]
MLRSLYIKQYALIEEINVEFERGLNILTGETGAGKSILIDALGLLLGDRASAEVVRKGAEKAVVEGTFAINGSAEVINLLKGNGIEATDELIVRREISTKGQHRCFINDSPVPLTLLKSIGDILVDLHGQHDHQALLRPETHIEFLDDFGDHLRELSAYRKSYQALTILLAKKRGMAEQVKRFEEKRDLNEFQLREIDALNPRKGEEEALGAELRILENGERLHQMTAELNRLLSEGSEGEPSVHDNLVLARKQIEALNGIDPAFNDAAGEAKSAEIIVEELAKFIQRYSSRIEINPQRLEELRERLGRLSLLKKKYGGSVEAILDHRAKVAAELELVTNYDKELRAVESGIEEERRECSVAAASLSARRQEAAKKISKSVVSALAELGISSARFSVEIRQIPFVPGESGDDDARPFVRLEKRTVAATPKGIDDVEFYLSTNVGEDLKPLAKVASGGEVSRVMLALKSALAQSDKTPLLIFDEIDVGVSGRIGQAVGLSLKKLSLLHQIIAITHLPQIAGLAETHFAVEKKEDGSRTSTRLRKLGLEDRVREVAKLMSGEKVTEAGLKGARELMGIEKK